MKGCRYDGWLFAQILSFASRTCGAGVENHDIVSEVAKSEPCDLPVVDVTSLTADKFGQHFRKLGRPVLLSNVGRLWAARKRWRRQEILDRYGDTPVLSQHVRVLNAAWQGNESVKSILLQGMGNFSVLLRQGHSMVHEMQGDWQVPPALAHIQREGPVMSIGDKHSQVVFHQHTESWLAQVQGKKLWILAAPGTDMSSWMSSSACEVSTKDFEAPLSERRLLRCVVLPKHAIYVPEQWYHGTCNLDDHSVAAGFFGGWWKSLTQVSAYGKLSIVKRTLEREGVSAPLQRDGPYTPFVAAAMRGHVAVVNELAAATRSLPHMQPVLSQALIGSCFSNSAPTAALLIRLRADPNAIDGSTPLSECTRLGAADMIAHLIQVRADINAAAVQDSFPVKGAPLAAKAGNHGHREILELLVAQRVSLNMRDKKDGRTVLQHSLGFPYVVDYLIQNRVDPLIQDDKGRSAIHDAVDRNVCHERTLESILSAAPLDTDFAADERGQRPLHLAAERGHAACSWLLLRHGVPGGSGQQGSPADLAARGGHWAVLQMLASQRGFATWPRGGVVSKAAWGLAASRGPEAEAWLRSFESDIRSNTACDIAYGTCTYQGTSG